MTPEDWKAIDDAFVFISTNRTTRIDGDKWSMYRIGSNVIRIDIKVDK